MKNLPERRLPLADCYDLALPDWGPYSKKYFGISHIADARRGYRCDFVLMPGLFRRDIAIPDALKEAGYTPWEAAVDLEYYRYRQQIEWQDRIYCDISFSRIDDHVRLLRCEGVNRTALPVALALHLVAGLDLPLPAAVEPRLPAGARWYDAADHAGLDFAVPRPQDRLVYDALRRGEERRAGTVGGSCVGQGFGRDTGDRIRFHLDAPATGAAAVLRFLLPAGEQLTLRLNGAATGTAVLTGTGDWSTAVIHCGDLSAGTLELIGEGGAALLLDGLAVGPEAVMDRLAFVPVSRDHTPVVTSGPVPDSAVITFPALSGRAYGWRWSEGGALQRCYRVRDFKETLLYDDSVHQHYCDSFDRGGDDRWAEVLMQPVTVPADGVRTVYALLCDGTPEEVRQRLAAAPFDAAGLDRIEAAARAGAIRLDATPAGEPYRFSQERMAAVTLTNVVYPIYMKRRYIRHSPPGRCWNSLYSWDSGFIGLGLLELDPARAAENLNAYVTDPGDPETAFIHHGTPLPVQHYLLLELWNRTRDRDLLAFFYPRLKQFYTFLAGHDPTSTTRRTTSSGLLKTWDYFYNSGGWDDYPPQWHVHKNRLHHIAPAVSTSHAIRAAKILSLAAAELGLDDDLALYRDDVDAFTAALQTWSWDPDSGCFGYVEHDAAGRPTGIFRHRSGVNFNLGLDGVTPLVAGVCTPEQRELFWSRLQAPERFWTPLGLSTVDRTAPYYRRDGYWNGSVWMPHQWFFWKAALNDGQADFAWRIAATALELWERETAATYCCFEHFSVESGRGGGWHHFSGLSTPVLSWFGAYFRPGRLTAGYDVWQRDFSVGPDGMSASLRIAGNADEITTVIAVPGDGDFSAEYAGQPRAVRRRVPGAVEIDLPKASAGVLTLRRRN